MMKRKVKTLWLEKEKDKEKEIACESFDDMIDCFIFIGYKNKNDNDKYIVVTHGLYKGIFIRPFCSYSKNNEDFDDEGTYYVFDTEKELYDWILEK